MPASELCFTPATELTRLIRTREVSAKEVMAAHLEQIERVNPEVNAIVTHVPPEQCLAAAEAADEAVRRDEPLGPLHGLPMAHKDLVPTKGLRTTSGSPIYAEHVPTEDGLIVERMKAAGGLTMGKTNVPEFGAGAQTFNPVFGATRNPYDTGRTCGGSSGGAAVALACGMVPVADGSDTGGSLRNPASFNNVVALRPSPGRVPVYPSPLGWWSISVQGPMARSVADAALLLSAMAGPDARQPISLETPGARFAEPLARDFAGTRIAWCPDLGGLPMDPQVAAVLESRRHVFGDLGCTVEEAAPDFTGAYEVFHVLRAWRFELRFTPLMEQHRAQMKDTVIWNTEYGQKLTGPQVAQAEAKRTEIYHRLRTFLERYDFLVCTTNQVPAFDVNTPYVSEIAGQRLETYIDWMASCWYLTITGLPALSVPCGFTPDGLPVGIQIVGRHHDDFGVLQLGHAFEQATQVAQRRPPLAG